MHPNQPHYFVYIFGENPRADVQIGIADDLQQHVQNTRNRSGMAQATTAGNKLVYYEHYDVEEIALNRERQIKNGGLVSTCQLIESMNPNWLDLSDTLT